ncbi:hypothetical protein BN871_JO_00100 [Paenibacillus sp. P22]|nr:hypothetical protein BN871_JO_00100 [Paenibacillus sp. P22]
MPLRPPSALCIPVTERTYEPNLQMQRMCSPMSIPAGASTPIILRLELSRATASFAQIATVIGDTGGDIVAIDVTRSDSASTVRDLTVNVYDQSHADRIASAVGQLPGVRVLQVSDQTFLLHIGGKIETTPKTPIKNRDDLSRVYTPGVARVCMAIHEKPSRAHTLTIKRNTIAVVSDGSAVLGLGNIGPEAAMPVMEGKAVLFKQFAGVDAFPICLKTTGYRGDHRDRQGALPDLRRHQSGGHLRSPLLRDRAAAGRGARYPRLPRRPARHGRRAAGRLAERRQAHRQDAAVLQSRRLRHRRCRHRLLQNADGRRRRQHRRRGPRRRPCPRQELRQRILAMVCRPYEPLPA